MSSPVIVARDLVVRRGPREVLAGASLDVASGEVVVLIGPNGAGKSTLLAAIAGDLAIASGSASVFGSSAGGADLAAMARLRAVVRQDTRVVSELTALEVVSLGRAPHGDIASASGLSIARRALEAVGLADASGRIVPRLSGGEQQRVHLARALAQIAGPALAGDSTERALAGGRTLAAPALVGALLLDQPTSSLDLAHAVGVLDLLRRLAQRGLAVLVVLHDLEHAARVADRIAVLDAGLVVAVGSPVEVLVPDLLGRVFGVRARVVDAPWATGRPWVGVEGLAE